MMRKLLSVCLLAPLISTAAAAQSFIGEGINSAVEAVQEGLDLIWPDELSLEDVNARVGFGIGTTPDYIGSDDYRLRVIPLLDIRYRDDWRLNGSLLTFTAKRYGKFEVGPLMNLRLGRAQERNPALHGLGSINTTIEMGAFARYKTDSALLSVDYRHGLASGIRSSVRLTAGHGIYKSQGGDFVAMLGLRAKWLSKGSMQTEFGITPTQSLTSEIGLRAFETDAGFSEVSVNLVGAYRLNEKIRFLSLVSYGHLLGDAKDSPLANEGVGSPSQLVVGGGIAFGF